MQSKPPLGRGGLMAAFIPAAATLVVYVLTLAPSIGDGDSPELVTAVHTLGVPHPTGYPLLVLLGKALETLLPLGSPAYRLNLVAAIFGAAAAGVLGWTAARVTRSVLWGVVAGLLVGFGRGLWGQSVAFEVYSLHALLIALVLAAVLSWEQRGTGSAALLVALACGFAMVHHRTAVFFAFPAWVWCTLAERRRGWRFVLGMAAVAAAPLLLYLVLFPLSWHRPVMDWGAVRLGWGNWWQHISGHQYAWRALKRPPAAAWHLAGKHWQGLLTGMTWLGLALALPGLVALRRHVLLPITMLGFLGTLFWAYTYNVGDALVFAMPAEMMLALWVALGLAQAARWLGGLARPRRRVAAGLPVLVAGALTVRLVTANWGHCDQSQAWYVWRDAMMLLAPCPQGAVLVVDGDTLFGSIRYLQEVARFRRDVLATSTVSAQDLNFIKSIKQPLLRQAADRAWHSLEDPTDLFPFQRQFVRTLVPMLHGRRLFTTLDPRGRAPEFVWKDMGMIQEVLPHWPKMEVPVPASVRGQGTPGFLGAEVLPGAVRRGEFFRVRIWWQPRSQISRLLRIKAKFIRLEPGPGKSHFGFGRRFPLCYGRVPLPACPPGRAWAQSGVDMVPQNAPPGHYLLQVLVESGSKHEQWLVPRALEVR